MKNQLNGAAQRLMLASAAALAVFVAASPAKAVLVDGTLDSTYGSPLSTQTVNTGFGDSPGGGDAVGGSELDAAYGTVQNGNLYLFLAGNIENNGNHFNVFIADGRVGQSVLTLPTTNTTGAMNGSIFSPGFSATEVLDVNDFGGTAYVEEYSTLGGVGTGTYQGSFALTNGVGSGSPDAGNASNPFTGSITYGLNNTNGAGVNGNTGTAASATAADAVTTGLEISIPLSLLGNPTSAVEVLADVNGGSDGFLSNQFAPGLPVGSGNVGGDGALTGFEGPNSATFDFATTPGEYFSVAAATPEPVSLGVIGGVAAMLFGRRRRV